MGKGIRAKLPKNKSGKYTFTRKQLDELMYKSARETTAVLCKLFMYNMKIDNNLTAEQVERQTQLLEIRAEAFLNGDLTEKEIDAFLEEKDGEIQE